MHISLEHFAASKPSWENICVISQDLVHTYVASGSFQRKCLANEHDKVFKNSLLQNQYYLLYEEITYAMNHGDVGHIEYVLGPWIAIFKGTGKNKYATLMMKFLTDVHFVYPESLQYVCLYCWKQYCSCTSELTVMPFD